MVEHRSFDRGAARAAHSRLIGVLPRGRPHRLRLFCRFRLLVDREPVGYFRSSGAASRYFWEAVEPKLPPGRHVYVEQEQVNGAWYATGCGAVGGLMDLSALAAMGVPVETEAA